eukprot:CAMPEP_0185361478 /NCGR_PEP_ID=MMETSP1364-20130426/10332_1 /TAXON_ID=38817 /ORGANISM="Gephyrocapsa oceanica, Strain RCC1303" /LENGTH=334 /DNA_ID=CAMNT_0027961815 /DNA_START=109 /DNA_END=1111 /DNA_ORIENTATION=-
MVPRSRISSATPPSYCSISALSRLQQRLWLWACVSRACWSAPGASGASARRGVSGAALEDPALHHEGAKLWPPAQRLVAVGGVRPSAAARAELETLVQVEARVQRRARRASAARPRAKRDATGRAVDKVAVGPRPREDPQPRVRREEEALARAKVLRRVCAPRLGSKAAKDAAVRVEHHEQRGAARGEAAVEGLQRAAVLVGREGQPPVVLPQPNRQRGAQRAQRCEREHRMQLEEEPSSEGGTAVHGIAALGALLLAGPGGATSAANASLSASERRLLSSHGRSGGAAAATCSRMLRNRRPVWLVSMKRKLRCCFEPEASATAILSDGDADFV